MKELQETFFLTKILKKAQSQHGKKEKYIREV